LRIRDFADRQLGFRIKKMGLPRDKSLGWGSGQGPDI
jgi:hypothetical protein